MGLRFRRSLKIAPGLKLNFNKNSIGVTAGTRGAHYTINSKGKRTSSVGIPGTGLSYTETTGGSKSSNSASKSSSSNSEKGRYGCLSILLILFLISIAIFLYSFAWIPGLIFIIYLAISKKFERKKKIIYIGIATLVCITSFILFGALNSESELSELEIIMQETEYDISDSLEVELSLTPSNATIDNVKISDNDIVVLNYSNEKAIISFKATGTATIYFIANDSIESNSVEITVVDKEAEQEKIEEEESQIQTEVETQQSEDVQQSPETNTEQPKVESEPVVVPEEPVQSQPEEPVAEQPAAQSYILNTNTKKFHYPSCSSVKTIKPENYGTFEGAREDIVGQGYEACGRCHP